MHCVKIVHIQSFFCPYFPALRLNTDRKNSEYGHFSRSGGLSNKNNQLRFYATYQPSKLNVQQIVKYFAINISWWRENCVSFPIAYPQKIHKNLHFPVAYQISRKVIKKLVDHKKFLFCNNGILPIENLQNCSTNVKPEVSEYYL